VLGGKIYDSNNNKNTLSKEYRTEAVYAALSKYMQEGNKKNQN